MVILNADNRRFRPHLIFTPPHAGHERRRYGDERAGAGHVEPAGGEYGEDTDRHDQHRA